MIAVTAQLDIVGSYVLNSGYFEAWDDQTWLTAQQMFENLQKNVKQTQKDHDLLWLGIVRMKKLLSEETHRASKLNEQLQEQTDQKQKWEKLTHEQEQLRHQQIRDIRKQIDSNLELQRQLLESQQLQEHTAQQLKNEQQRSSEVRSELRNELQQRTEQMQDLQRQLIGQNKQLMDRNKQLREKNTQLDDSNRRLREENTLLREQNVVLVDEQIKKSKGFQRQLALNEELIESQNHDLKIQEQRQRELSNQLQQHAEQIREQAEHNQ